MTRMTLDVLIVGAGPTGLMLACELGLLTLPSPTGLLKALGLQARAMVRAANCSLQTSVCKSVFS